MDVHLMIERPEHYVKDFAESGADLINFHIEATDQAEETIHAIRALGIWITPKGRDDISPFAFKLNADFSVRKR